MDKKLTDAQVREILQDLTRQLGGNELAAKFGVSGTVINNIKLGRTYKHIERPPQITNRAFCRRQLTEAEVLDIAKHLRIGTSRLAIARHYNIGRSRIDSIAGGFSWKHLNLNLPPVQAARHPRKAEILEAIRLTQSNREVAEQFGVDPQYVANLRWLENKRPEQPESVGPSENGKI